MRKCLEPKSNLCRSLYNRLGTRQNAVHQIRQEQHMRVQVETCEMNFLHVIIYIFLNYEGTKYSCLENPMDGGAWQGYSLLGGKSQTWLSDFTFTFHFRALEKAMATYSSVLAWRIPGTGEPGVHPSSYRWGNYYPEGRTNLHGSRGRSGDTAGDSKAEPVSPTPPLNHSRSKSCPRCRVYTVPGCDSAQGASGK